MTVNDAAAIVLTCPACGRSLRAVSTAASGPHLRCNARLGEEHRWDVRPASGAGSRGVPITPPPIGG